MRETEDAVSSSRLPVFRIPSPPHMDTDSDTGGGTAHRNLLPAVACTVAIAALSLWPKPQQPPEALMFPHADKAAHAIMYAVYAVVLAWTFRAGVRTWRTVAAIAAYGAVFGVAMELMQAAFPALERTLSGLDMLANAIGSLAGAAICRIACAHRNRTNERTEEVA